MDFRKRLRILKIGGIVLGVYVLIRLIPAIKEGKQGSAELLPITFKLTSEDSSLILPRYYSVMKANQLVQTTVRHPFSWFFFKNDYNVIAYKIDITKDVPIDSLIKVEHDYAGPTTLITYQILQKDVFFKFRFKIGKVDPTSQVFLTLDGDSVQKNHVSNNLICYHLIADGLALRYEKNGPVDIAINKGENLGERNPIPMDVVFLKRGLSLYFLVLTAKSPSVNVPSGLLYDIVQKG